MASPTVHYIPRITVQHDFQSVVDDIRQGLHAVEDVWVSCYSEGRPSVHGKIRVSETDQAPCGIELESRGGVECEVVDKDSLRISCPALDIPPTLVRLPSSTPCSTKGSLESLDVSSNCQRLVVGGKNGLVQVTTIQAGTQPLSLRGHVSDVNVVKFFPSGEVVLTGSLDMNVKVFSATDGSNPRTLRGHTKAVTDLYVVGRGRTVLTSSLDGTIRLWQVSDASLLRKWVLQQPVTAMVVVNASEMLGDDLKDCICVAAHSNGTATVLALDSVDSEPHLILDTGKTSPLHCLALDTQLTLLAVGSRSGLVSVFECPKAPIGEKREPIACFARSSSAITSLAFSDSRLLVTTSDGLPFEVELGSDGNVQGEWVGFAGFEAGDSAAKGLYVGQDVLIAGGDGSVRLYESNEG
ncbi:hypothetical protein ACM66B_006468 [Microbotryomycetes sp. NB124-2]